MADKKRHTLRNYLLKMLLYIRYYVDLIIDNCFGIYYDRIVDKRLLPECSNKLVLNSASKLATQIRQQKITVFQVVSAFIERCQQVNGTINALVDNRFEEALQDAQLLDQNIVSGRVSEEEFDRKPFLGIPFTTKESTAAKGLSNTFGLKKRINIKAEQDAYVVERLKAAGGILIGVSNVPQLNLWQETSNPLFGTTRNPYDTTRNVGGSSGGEAAIIAACGSPIGIGTDIGGSIRIPAYMCGVFGHKPTSDLISTRGLTYRTGNEFGETMVVAGPMTKYAEDLSPLLQVLLGDNWAKLNLAQPVDLSTVKVLYVTNPRDPFVSPFRQEMKIAFQKAVRHFKEILPPINAPLELQLPQFQYGGKLWRYWMTQEPNCNFKRDVTNREFELNTFQELVKYSVGHSDYNAAIMLNLINGVLPAENSKWIREKTAELRTILIEKLGNSGVLLYPSAPWPASYHHTSLLRPWNFNLFSIWNALKLPVTQVPLALAKNGLPMGIQVVAAPYCDHLCIAIARELESAFGGYTPPFASV